MPECLRNNVGRLAESRGLSWVWDAIRRDTAGLTIAACPSRAWCPRSRSGWVLAYRNDGWSASERSAHTNLQELFAEGEDTAGASREIRRYYRGTTHRNHA